ncbi:MAG: hypothetical protein MHMPM18_000742 [Marteilia pararefringens]
MTINAPPPTFPTVTPSNSSYYYCDDDDDFTPNHTRRPTAATNGSNSHHQQQLSSTTPSSSPNSQFSSKFLANFHPITSILPINSQSIGDEVMQTLGLCLVMVVGTRNIKYIMDFDDEKFGTSLIHNLLINQIYDDAIFEFCSRGKRSNDMGSSRPTVQSFALKFLNRADIWEPVFESYGKANTLKFFLTNIVLIKNDNNTYVQILGPKLRDIGLKNPIFELKKDIFQTVVCKESDRFYLSDSPLHDSIACLFKCRHDSSNSTCILQETVSFYQNNFYFNHNFKVYNSFVGISKLDINKIPKKIDVNSANAIQNYSPFFEELSSLHPQLKIKFNLMYTNLQSLNLYAIFHTIMLQTTHNSGKKGKFMTESPNYRQPDIRNSVVYFLKTVLKQTIDVYLLGNNGNMKILNSAIVNLLKYPQKISMVVLIRRFKLSAIEWLKGFHNYHKVRIFSHFIWFLLKDIVYSVFSYFFLVGKTSRAQVAPMIYMKKEWVTLMRDGFQKYLKERPNFIKLSESSLNSHIAAKAKQPIVHRLKLIPTSTNNVRPICDMKETNKKLKYLLSILHSLFDFDPSLSGYGIVNDSIERALTSFISNGNYSSYKCIGKTDISKCYDSINRKKLFEILDEISVKYSGYKFVTFGYFLFLFDKSRYCFKYKTIMVHETEFTGNICIMDLFNRDVTQKTVPSKYPTIILQCSVLYFDRIKSVVKKIKNSLSNILLKNQNRLFELVNGIPQGHLLSTYLCNIYLGYIERQNLIDIIDPKETGIIRFVDDYLIFSRTDFKLYETLSFLDACLPLNSEKNMILLNNLSDDPDKSITWCGIRVQYNHLICVNECYADLDRNLNLNEGKYDMIMHASKSCLNSRLKLSKYWTSRIVFQKTKLELLSTIQSESSLYKLAIDIAAYIVNFLVRRLTGLESLSKWKKKYHISKIVNYLVCLISRRLLKYSNLKYKIRALRFRRTIGRIFKYSLEMNLRSVNVLNVRYYLQKHYRNKLHLDECFMSATR